MRIELGEHIFEVTDEQITNFCGQTLVWLSDKERKRFLRIIKAPFFTSGGFKVRPTNMPNTELHIMV